MDFGSEWHDFSLDLQLSPRELVLVQISTSKGKPATAAQGPIVKIEGRIGFDYCLLDGIFTFMSEQNEQVKKISSWAAIFFAPSFVAGVYGMNFDHMPELHWALGYPLAIAMMAATAALMYTIFKRKGWL